MASSSLWAKDALAVVTGANKGIGFEIAKQLALNGLTVVLTARDQQRGLNALTQLKHVTHSTSSRVVFQRLDVCNSDSVSNFAAWLTKEYKGVDILVNNAGVIDRDSSHENAKLVLDTNYDGVKRVTNALLPCMKASSAGARIINVSSQLGQLQVLSSSLRREMENPETLSVDKVDSFVDRFLQAVEEGNARAKGWPSGGYTSCSAYCVSKLALNAYTRVLARSLQERPKGHKIYVNCFHPGYVITDLTNNMGMLTPEKGAESAVWLALLPPPVPTGEFFYQRKPLKF